MKNRKGDKPATRTMSEADKKDEVIGVAVNASMNAVLLELAHGDPRGRPAFIRRAIEEHDDYRAVSKRRAVVA